MEFKETRKYLLKATKEHKCRHCNIKMPTGMFFYLCLKEGEEIHLCPMCGVSLTPFTSDSLLTMSCDELRNYDIEFLDVPTEPEHRMYHLMKSDIRYDQFDKLVRLLKAFPDLINLRDLDWSTPLHIEVEKELKKPKQENHIPYVSYQITSNQVISLLLDSGADVNVQDIFLRTPLHSAVIYQNMNMVKLLVEHNADMNIRDNKWMTSLQYAFGINIDMFKYLLSHGGDANTQEKEGWTFLHHIIGKTYNSSWRISLGRMLYNNNADLTIKNNDGLNPVEMAIQKFGQKETEYLLEKMRE